jgi:RND superfamily putative drug exporter
VFAAPNPQRGLDNEAPRHGQRKSSGLPDAGDFVHGDTAEHATPSGMGQGARVVTAESIIMISVFSGFILLDDATIKSMGFALAAGVAIDAFVVRMTIAPAVMSLRGD